MSRWGHFDGILIPPLFLSLFYSYRALVYPTSHSKYALRRLATFHDSDCGRLTIYSTLQWRKEEILPYIADLPGAADQLLLKHTRHV
jgi:hypothetical protein